MSTEHSDKRLASIVRCSLVSKGFRPTSLVDIEAMLDTIGGEAPSPEKLARMLSKVRGDESIGALQRKAEEATNTLTPAQQELVALYRTRGKEVPSAIQAKLDAMRRRARGQDEVKDGD